jgi:hypothetical protein
MEREDPSSSNAEGVGRVNPRDAMVKIQQANCATGKNSILLALEKGVEQGADLVVIQKPHKSKLEEYQIFHLAFKFIKRKESYDRIES